MSGNIEQKLRKVERWMEDKAEEIKTIKRRNFNARTGEKGEGVVEGGGIEKNERRR